MSDRDDRRPLCGIMMPISATDGCNEAHWAEVQMIISEALNMAGFASQLVSASDDIGVIQKRIVENLYNNPIVVCDVSGKNPNVMFELGMRLAFDKPTVIIKDDATSYSFDTSPIEHVGYPRDLRYAAIVNFKKQLTEKVRATHEKAAADPNYSPFLKNFGTFTIARLDQKEIPVQEKILEELAVIRADIRFLQSKQDAGLRYASALSVGSMSTENFKWVPDPIDIEILNRKERRYVFRDPGLNTGDENEPNTNSKPSKKA